jgi:SAM-dependent methyltransferase
MLKLNYFLMCALPMLTACGNQTQIDGGYHAMAYAEAEQDPPRLDVPYVPTPQPVVDEMLRLANVKKDELVYDLGCGDGRIVITAVAKHGARGIGVDLDPARIEDSNRNAQAAGVTDRVKFVVGDLFEMDFSDADVVMMYLLPSVNLKLRPTILEKLRPGTRIVSHAFDMGDWEPDVEREVDGRRVYLWYVPARVAGNWRVEHDGRTYNLHLNQTYQKMDGRMRVGDQDVQIRDASIQGEWIRFTMQAPGERNPRTFEGRLTGTNRLQGSVFTNGQRTPWNATLGTP